MSLGLRFWWRREYGAKEWSQRLAYMASVTRKLFGSSVSFTFGVPRPFAKPVLDDLAVAALAKFERYGLRPEHVRLRTTDVLFDYSLSFDLFNRGLKFHANPEEVGIEVTTGAAPSDDALIAELMTTVASLVRPDEFSSVQLTAFAHVEVSPEHIEETTKAYFPDEQTCFIGKVLRCQLPGWEQQIRLVVDKSMVCEHGFFLSWSTWTKDVINPELLQGLQLHYYEAANLCDLQII